MPRHIVKIRNNIDHKIQLHYIHYVLTNYTVIIWLVYIIHTCMGFYFWSNLLYSSTLFDYLLISFALCWYLMLKINENVIFVFLCFLICKIASLKHWSFCAGGIFAATAGGDFCPYALFINPGEVLIACNIEIEFSLVYFIDLFSFCMILF